MEVRNQVGEPFLGKELPFPVYFLDEQTPSLLPKRGSMPHRVAVHSIPKAGTYLLGKLLSVSGWLDTEIHLMADGFTDYRGKTIQQKREDYLELLVPAGATDVAKIIHEGQFVVGHLPCDDQIKQVFRDFKQLFIYRDLRDCLVSHMRFLEKRKNPSHEIWSAIDDGKQKFLKYLEHSGHEFFNIARPMIAWLDEKNVEKICFEKLCGDAGSAVQNDEITRIFDYLGVSRQFSFDELVQKVFGANTLTWSGKRSDRTEYWSEDAQGLFMEYGGDRLNLLLGYPPSYSPQTRNSSPGVNDREFLPMPKFVLDAKKLIAEDSPDHIAPRGTKQDNSYNPLFNKKLYALFEDSQLHVLDFGCAGGAFVKACVDDGHAAVGLDGSDYSKNTGRAEWVTIPDNLFTCDITAEFQIKDATSDTLADAKFDVITAWEFMEHISQEDLIKVCENATRHLKDGGLWILSIADFDEVVGAVNYHQTVQSKEWWEEFFISMGFTNHPELEEYFGDDWVRGPLQGSQSFHFVLTYGDVEAPSVPEDVPYTGHDLIETGMLCIEKTIADGIFSNLTLEYALALFDRAEEMLGVVDDLNYGWALTFLYLGRVEEAKSAATSELDLQPEHSAAREMLIQLDHLAQEDTLRGFDEFIFRLNRGILLREQGDLVAARANLERAVALRPDDEGAAQQLRETLKVIAQKALENEEWEDAGELLARFPDELPSDPEWHFFAAQALHLQKKTLLARAQHQYDLALEFGYPEFGVRLHRGILLREMGEMEASATDLERAAELRPDDSDAAEHLQKTLKAMESASAKESHPVGEEVEQPKENSTGQAQASDTLQLLLDSDDIITALQEYENLLDQDLLKLVQTNAQAAHVDGNVELAKGLGNLAAYIEEVLSSRIPIGAPNHLKHSLDEFPMISIVTPVYNAGDLIATCIESVLAQGYPNFEHIIVDGASDDGTVEVLKQYPHLKWISEPDNGEAEALNKALRMAKGDYIGWLNADDSYAEGALLKVGAVLKANPKYHLVYGKAVFIDEDGYPTNWVVPYAPLNMVTLARWFRLNLFQPSIFFSRQLYQDVGPYREDLEYGVDYEYWFRIAAKGYGYHYIDDVLSKAMIYRSGGKTEAAYTVKAAEWLDICKSYLPLLSTGEQIYFWKDFYDFRLRMHNHAFYFDKAEIELPQSDEAVSGLMLALQELSMMDSGLLSSFVQTTLLESSNFLGILATHLHNNNRATEARKAFEWALALETNDPSMANRFSTPQV